MLNGRLPATAHTDRPWRIHDIAPDFRVLDVWALPTPGGADDFPRLVESIGSYDAERSSPVVHALFAIRWALGRVFGLDGAGDGIDSRVTGLRHRLPEELRDSCPDDAAAGPFTPLYLTDDEAALEIANRTMHGVLHLGWVPDGDGGYQGQMTVLVKPNGLLGAGYLAAIAPFRHLVVYPAMLRTIGRLWRERPAARATVTQIDVPPDAYGLSTLSRVDYADAFLVAIDPAPDWAAGRWAGAVLEEAPAATRARLLAGWSGLGLRSAEDSATSVLGWAVRRSTDDTLLLGRDSLIGMPGELLFALRPNGLLFATFVHHHTAATRPVWSAVERTHVRTVLMLLEQAARRATGADVTESAGAG